MASSLGGPETLVISPANSTHVGLSAEELEAAGIGPGLVRVSVGLEHPDDLLADFEHALEPDLIGLSSARSSGWSAGLLAAVAGRQGASLLAGPSSSASSSSVATARDRFGRRSAICCSPFSR